MSAPGDSIHALLKDPVIGPLFGPQLRRVLASTYDDFADAVEQDLEDLIVQIERGASLRCDDEEDRLTDELLLGLRAQGYQATHDEYINGHSDIVVKSRFSNYAWLGEAKIHRSYQWLLDGFSQLCTRYSTGTVDNCRGGILIYIRNSNAKSVLEKWSNALGAHFKGTGKDITIKADAANPLRLRSIHQHEKSGLDYRVRHFGLVMHFDPQK